MTTFFSSLLRLPDVAPRHMRVTSNIPRVALCLLVTTWWTDACTPCDDEPGVLDEYLRLHDLTCSTYSFGLNFRCNISSAWREGRICRHSCYLAGNGCALLTLTVGCTPLIPHAMSSLSRLTTDLDAHITESAPLPPSTLVVCR